MKKRQGRSLENSLGIQKNALGQIPIFCRLMFSLFFMAATFLQAQPASRQQLLKGGNLYDKKNYLKAENVYRQAANDPIALYNAGNAAYQQGKLAAAVDLYKKASASGNTSTRANAYYNLGNALLRQKKYQEAIGAYQSSLRLQPDCSDSKKNLQIAKNKLREQEEPPPPPPPPPPQRPRRYYVDRAQKAQKKEVPTGNMTAEKARQLLEQSIEQEEQKNARQYRALPAKARPSGTKKDW